MSKTSILVNNMNNGEFLSDKRSLSAIKRMGLIKGYDEWGNIESADIKYLSESGAVRTLKYSLFPKGNVNEISAEPYNSKKELEDTFGINRTIKYENVVFTIGCPSGHYTPQLVKVGSVKKVVS